MYPPMDTRIILQLRKPNDDYCTVKKMQSQSLANHWLGLEITEYETQAPLSSLCLHWPPGGGDYQR